TMTYGDFALLEFEPVHLTAEAQSFAEVSQSSSVFSALPLRSLRLCGEKEFARQARDEESLRLIASLERYSEHPLARAVLKRAESEGVELLEAREVEIRKGLGLTGTVAGHEVFVGNRHLAEEQGVRIDFSTEVRAGTLEAQGRTAAFFGWDGQLRGLMAFGDRVRIEAAAVIGDLRQRGVKTMIVSGDAQATTSWVASSVGADDFIAEALPGDKTAVIERLQQQGQIVAMIGDGINDAPALAQADLGIAVGSGADIAIRAAAIVLMTNSLDKLSEVFALANKTWRVVRQNLFWAFFYNALGISLAVAGILNPIMAAGAMLLSSLSVIGNSLRLSRR
ncbi:MAG: HAD-IC family P-type ATPase, partial [Acidobacteriota bacterium]